MRKARLDTCVPVICLLTILSVSGVIAAAVRQDAAAGAAPQFEVGTIRINRSGELRARHSLVPATGQVTITNTSVRDLIQDAYDLQMPSLIVNMPGWAGSQRVDVAAKAPGPAPAAVLQRMLQPLLAEYFKLAVHRETREMDVFALVVASEGRLGPKLQKTAEDCEGAVGTSNRLALAPAASTGQRACGILPGGAGRIVARGLDMAGLADLLASNRVVIDRTGVTGRFDIDLTYTPDAFTAAAMAQRPGSTLPPGIDPSGPPLATALQEQLGLKLTTVRAPVDVLVIDKAEPLAAN